jgi:hypothetical protein
MRTLLTLSMLAAAVAVGCSGSPMDGSDDAEQDLTSASARARKLTFSGWVYVDATASDAEILAAVRTQTQTAFGALRTSQIGVASRELKGVDPSTFKKTKVTVVDPSKPTDPGTAMIKVTYTYKDDAVVPVSMARRTSLSSAVMSPDYRSQTQRILKECTANDSEAREFSSSIWYVFDPSVPSCKTAMAAEQKQIDADKAKISGSDRIPTSEVNRLYYPLTMKLSAAATEKGNTFPEYDRLYSGGVKPNRLVISMVNGLIDHESHGAPSQDSAWGEWMDELAAAMSGRSFKFASIDNNADLTTYTVSGKTVRVPGGFMDAIKMATDGTNYPAGLSYSERDALMAAISQKVTQHWLRFEAPVKVKIGTQAEKDFTIEIMTYFGAGSDSAPHKYAIKNSDVFLYNGHSYIGYGPLDPSNFSKSDFPSSYQILFIDGCVSYNYYNTDYFPLKTGEDKNLDMIVNGLEAPSWHSGYALGRFTSKLIDGKQESYLALLQAASDTDSLRVVDGEVGNVYKPTRTPITVR